MSLPAGDAAPPGPGGVAASSRSEKAGRVRTCRIEPAVLRTAEQWITQRRATWKRRLDRLGDYLAEQDDQTPEGANHMTERSVTHGTIRHRADL